MSTSLWLCKVWSAVEPSIEGPFKSETARKNRAKEMWKDCDESRCDNVFKLNVSNGVPIMFPFVTGELPEKK